MKEAFFIGTDIGGTTFSSGLFDNHLHLIKISDKGYISDYIDQKSLLNAISEQIKSISFKKNISNIGFACPGPLDSVSGKILNTPNLTILQNCHLKVEMEKRLKIPCSIENDANLFALGEWVDCTHRKDVFIGITLGTGLGFGIVINGRLYTGGNGMAAEYGISPVSSGNWESDISIRGIKKIASEFNMRDLSPEKLYILANQNDENALQIWNYLGNKIGFCISHIINLLDPNAISIGGGIAHAFNYFETNMIITLQKNCPSFNHHSIKIYESINKEISSMKGAVNLIS